MLVQDIAAEAGTKPGWIIALGNLKGGTGKSTIAVNLAAALSRAGWQVCVVDTDPQATSHGWLSRSRLPIAAERKPLKAVRNVEAWMLEADRLVQQHDIVLVDLPAVVAPAMASAFLLAHLILVPVSPSRIDVAGTRRVLKHIRTAAAERPGAPPRVLLVPNRVGTNEAQAGRLENSLGSLELNLGPRVRADRLFDEAFAAGRWIGDHAAGSDAEADILALRRAVVEELIAAPAPPILEKLQAGRRRGLAQQRPGRRGRPTVSAPPSPPSPQRPRPRLDDDEDDPHPEPPPPARREPAANGNAAEAATNNTAAPTATQEDEAPAGPRTAPIDPGLVEAVSEPAKRIRSAWRRRRRFQQLGWIATGLGGVLALIVLHLWHGAELWRATLALDSSAITLAALVIALGLALPYLTVRAVWRLVRRRSVQLGD